ncbi:MAG: DUF4058 family protein [Gemmataceae bacterium]|nr:DUF4058 family protein [Gemmataceae bacterium]
MPLLDHFRPPLSETRSWESFYGAWAVEITAALNRTLLPDNCFAEVQFALSSRIDVDLHPPQAPALVLPTSFPDDIEVQVFRSSGGANLVAAVELVSPANKDRPEHRQAFAAKCASYLQRRIGLVILDIVTERHANLHDELVRILGQPKGFTLPEGSSLYAVAYRPSRRATGDQIEIWPYILAVGQALPTMPLPLRDGPTLPLDLEATYSETRARSRL